MCCWVDGQVWVCGCRRFILFTQVFVGWSGFWLGQVEMCFVHTKKALSGGWVVVSRKFCLAGSSVKCFWLGQIGSMCPAQMCEIGGKKCVYQLPGSYQVFLFFPLEHQHLLFCIFLLLHVCFVLRCCFLTPQPKIDAHTFFFRGMKYHIHVFTWYTLFCAYSRKYRENKYILLNPQHVRSFTRLHLSVKSMTPRTPCFCVPL